MNNERRPITDYPLPIPERLLLKAKENVKVSKTQQKLKSRESKVQT
ncbi:MAG: hypothetical protein AB4290_10730 [Spirulina sp.]